MTNSTPNLTHTLPYFLFAQRSDDEGWSTEMIEEQKEKCERAFYVFLKEFYTAQEKEVASNSEESSFSIFSSGNLLGTTTTATANIETDVQNPTPTLRARGVSRKRREMMERQKSTDDADEARTIGNVSKRKKTMLASLLADSSTWVKSQVAENKELGLYLSSDDASEFSIPPILQLYDNKTAEEYIENKNKDLGLSYATKPLVYWNRYTLKYPLLSQFARRLLGVSSTSVASERLFSQAKAFIITDRARLEPETAEKYVLLYCWHREFNQSLSVS